MLSSPPDFPISWCYRVRSLENMLEYTRRYPEAHGSCRSWHGNMILWSRIFPIFNSVAQIQIAAGVQFGFMLGKLCSCAPQVQQLVAELWSSKSLWPPLWPAESLKVWPLAYSRSSPASLLRPLLAPNTPAASPSLPFIQHFLLSFEKTTLSDDGLDAHLQRRRSPEGERASLALCKEESCAHSALSAGRAASRLHARHAAREEWGSHLATSRWCQEDFLILGGSDWDDGRICSIWRLFGRLDGLKNDGIAHIFYRLWLGRQEFTSSNRFISVFSRRLQLHNTTSCCNII